MALAGWRSRRTIPRSSWGSRASSRYGRRREAAVGTPGAAAGAAPAPRAASPPHPGNGAPRSPLRFAPPLSQYRALIGPQPPRHWPAELSLRATAPCPRRVPRRAGTGASQRGPVARGAARRAGGRRVAGSSPWGAAATRRGVPAVAWRGLPLLPRGWRERTGSVQGAWQGRAALGWSDGGPSCRVGCRDAPGGRLANPTRQCQHLVPWVDVMTPRTMYRTTACVSSPWSGHSPVPR